MTRKLRAKTLWMSIYVACIRMDIALTAVGQQRASTHRDGIQNALAGPIKALLSLI